MRTTLDLDDDILQAAREIAARERSTIGKVVSRLARAGLHPATSPAALPVARPGVPVFPARPGEVVTIDHVRKLMQEEAI